MKKRLIASATCLCLLLIMLLSSTLAWFTDQTEATKSTMTVGNVEILQLEQYREYQDDGSFILRPWHMAESSYPANLYPAVHLGSDVPAGTKVQLNGTGEYDLYNQDQNVIDKIVSVMNVGSDSAYVRTVFAFEMMWDGLDWVNPIGDEVMLNCNEKQSIIFPKTDDGKDVVIYRPAANGSDDAAFVIGFATYSDALEANSISAPSLLQFWLNQNVEDDDAFRTSVGGEYEILILSQAVQTAGFGDYGAVIALDAAFGPVNAQNAAKWFGEEYTVPPVVFEITDLASLYAALANGGEGILKNDLGDAFAKLAEEKTFVLDLNGKSITGGTVATGDVADGQAAFESSGALTIKNGTINSDYITVDNKSSGLNLENVTLNTTDILYGFYQRSGETVMDNVNIRATRGGMNISGGKVTLNNVNIEVDGYSNKVGYTIYAGSFDNTVTVVINGGTFTYNQKYTKYSVVYADMNATVIINGGTFGKGGSGHKSGGWIRTANGGTVTIYGGTFEFDPSAFVAKDEGYQAVQGEDGWWTVSKIEG